MTKSAAGVELGDHATLGMIRCPFKIGDKVVGLYGISCRGLSWGPGEVFTVTGLPHYLDGSVVTLQPSDGTEPFEYEYDVLRKAP